jgi:hypothetical protein
MMNFDTQIDMFCFSMGLHQPHEPRLKHAAQQFYDMDTWSIEEDARREFGVREFDDTNKPLYLLSESARDNYITQLLFSPEKIENIKITDENTTYLYSMCYLLNKRKLFNSSPLFVMRLPRYVKRRATAIQPAYDIDRERGRKRVLQIIKQGAR